MAKIDYSKFKGHTPGPWEATEEMETKDKRVSARIDTAGWNGTVQFVCHIYERDEPVIDLAGGLFSIKRPHEQSPNALLLAAAPDLLARCLELEGKGE